jgi:hypothetical protein
MVQEIKAIKPYFVNLIGSASPLHAIFKRSGVTADKALLQSK